MAFPGLVRANNLSDIIDREKAWDNICANIEANYGLLGGLDIDASNYIQAVAIADGLVVEPLVQLAINNFVTGCKADGIWNAIKSSCILAGARTLDGALVPLVGTAPTNYNFVANDYNRKTGLLANGTTKLLDTNQSVDFLPQNSKHVSIYVSSVGGGTTYFSNSSINGVDTFADASAGGRYAIISGSRTVGIIPSNNSLLGLSRSNANDWQLRIRGSTYDYANTVGITSSASILLQARRNTTSGAFESFRSDRLAFYSIGETIDLAKLETRVSALISTIATAIL